MNLVTSNLIVDEDKNNHIIITDYDYLSMNRSFAKVALEAKKLNKDLKILIHFKDYYLDVISLLEVPDFVEHPAVIRWRFKRWQIYKVHDTTNSLIFNNNKHSNKIKKG